MSSNEGRFETRGVWFFPQALHSSHFPAGEETLVPMTERTFLCPARACSQAMILSNLNSHQFVMMCTLFFDWSLRCLLVWYFFLRHSIESGVLLHFLRRYTKQFHQNIFCWVLQSLFALRSQTKAAGRS